jgi:hypothetical protein
VKRVRCKENHSTRKKGKAQVLAEYRRVVSF